MPEMTVQVRWPDGQFRQYYSPSLVLHDHLAPGSYRVDDFRSRATTALEEASSRVRAKYGFACTSAAASAEAIAGDAARHPDSAEVEVVSMYPPLPGAEVSTRVVASLRPGSTSGESAGEPSLRPGSTSSESAGESSLRPGSTSGEDRSVAESGAISGGEDS